MTIIAVHCTWCNTVLNLDEYVTPLKIIVNPITGEERQDFLCNNCSHDEEAIEVMEKEFLE